MGEPGTPQCSDDCAGDAGGSLLSQEPVLGRLGQGLHCDRHIPREQRAMGSETREGLRVRDSTQESPLE